MKREIYHPTDEAVDVEYVCSEQLSDCTSLTAVVEEHLDSSYLPSLIGDNAGLSSNGKINVPGEIELICDRINSSGGQLFKHGCQQTTGTFKKDYPHTNRLLAPQHFQLLLSVCLHTEKLVFILIHISYHGQATLQPH